VIAEGKCCVQTVIVHQTLGKVVLVRQVAVREQVAHVLAKIVQIHRESSDETKKKKKKTTTNKKKKNKKKNKKASE
jgi:hypothetical protein